MVSERGVQLAFAHDSSLDTRLSLEGYIAPLCSTSPSPSTMSDSNGAVQQVIQALQVLYQDPDPLAKEKANAWLSEFQKSVSGMLWCSCGACQTADGEDSLGKDQEATAEALASLLRCRKGLRRLGRYR